MPFVIECKSCEQKCIELDTNGNKLVGKRLEPFVCYFNKKPFSGNIENMLGEMENLVITASSQIYPTMTPPSGQSFRNLRGAWFEYIVAIASKLSAIEYNRENKTKFLVIKLPDAGKMEFWKLYDASAQDVLNDLFRTLAEKGIHLTMSNPDIICIRELDDFDYSIYENAFENIDIGSLRYMLTESELIRNKCPYNSICFALGIKTNTRPDRRYQMIYEGSITKAMVSHLRMRFWDREFKIKYFAIVNGVPGDKDRFVFQNPTIDSIIDIDIEPQKAVNELCACSKIEDIKSLLNRLLREEELIT